MAAAHHAGMAAVALRAAIPVEVTATAAGKKGFGCQLASVSSHGPGPFQRGSGRFLCFECRRCSARVLRVFLESLHNIRYRKL
jgi:hypothetical protein